MHNRWHWIWTLGSTVLLVGGGSLGAQELRSEGPGNARATISVESKSKAELDPAKLKLELNGHAAPVEGLTHVRVSSAQVAILIDEGLRHSFGVQVQDLKAFIASLPEGTQVLVGYMRNGTVAAQGGFSADHSAVAGAIRMPLGVAGASASPYFCLSDFAKKWPGIDSGPRFLMMITNGVDPYNGSVSPLNQNSPYVQTAIEDAQRAGLTVYSIAYGDAGVRGGAASFSGQGYLNEVADATGGRNLWQGSGNPVSIGPFLKEFRSAIAESYTATFHTSGRSDHGLTRVKITTSQRGVKLHAPSAVPTRGAE